MPDNDEKQGWISTATNYLIKQEPTTVIAFSILVFIGYWMLYEHPKAQEANRNWHKAQATEFKDSIEKLAEKQVEAQKERVQMHVEEVKEIRESADKNIDRIVELYKGK